MPAQINQLRFVEIDKPIKFNSNQEPGRSSSKILREVISGSNEDLTCIIHKIYIFYE